MSSVPLLGKAGSEVGRELAEPQPLGGQLWPSVHVTAGAEARLAEGPEGWVSLAPWVSEVGSMLGPLSGHNVLDCFTAWLTDRNSGWQRVWAAGRLGGGQPV